jgi:hypothetical protein
LRLQATQLFQKSKIIARCPMFSDLFIHDVEDVEDVEDVDVLDAVGVPCGWNALEAKAAFDGQSRRPLMRSADLQARHDPITFRDEINNVPAPVGKRGQQRLKYCAHSL